MCDVPPYNAAQRRHSRMCFAVGGDSVRVCTSKRSCTNDKRMAHTCLAPISIHLQSEFKLPIDFDSGCDENSRCNDVKG